MSTTICERRIWHSGDRVYVHGEDGPGTVTASDDYSLYVRMDSDGVTVAAAYEQVEPIPSAMARGARWSA